MAVSGRPTRQVVQDQNAPQGGNAPSQQFAVTGIQRPSGNPNQSVGRGLTDAINAFGVTAGAQGRKADNAAFVSGQLSAAAGKTQAQVQAEGNSTTLAGFVSIDIANAMSDWQQEHIKSASTEHFNTPPEQYQNMLAKSAADLISKMGGDRFAEKQLNKHLQPTLQKLGASQAAAHAAYTLKETSNSYSAGLIKSGQDAAASYEGSSTNPTAGPSVGAVKGGAFSDYKSYASSFVDQLIGVESSGVATAQNPNSSAGGLGQFIDSTWIDMMRRHRPDLVASHSRSDLLKLKFNGQLNREMTVALSAENAAKLDRAGLAMTPTNSYLMHFAGAGGGKRVLQGDPNASVSTSLTRAQIASNKGVTWNKAAGRLKTNAEMIAWSARKMKQKVGATPNGTGNVQASVLTNPGLPPEMHKNAVVNALIQSLGADDGSLYQTVGGIGGLAGLNLSPVQLAKVQAANKAFTSRRQNAYNQDYERQKHDILEQAKSGDFTEDEVFNMVTELQETYKRTDQEMLRTHKAVQTAIDKEDAEVASSVWATPNRQLDLVEIKNDLEDGLIDVKEASHRVQQIGKLFDADEKSTAKAVGVIMKAYNQVRADERNEAKKAAIAGRKAAVKRDEAERLIAMNALGTGTKAQQQMGIEIMGQELMKEMAAANVPPHEMASRGNAMIARALVNNDVVDLKRAAIMRASLANPIGPDGKPTPAAVESLTFYMDLTEGSNASLSYMTRMFAGQENTLALLSEAKQHMIGDANPEVALNMAWDQINNPVTQARLTDTRNRIDSGAIQAAVKQSILDDSGLENSAWNNVMNMFNADFLNERLSAEQVDRFMADSGLSSIIETEVRSATAIYPNSSQQSISEVVAGQLGNRGAIIGGSFVVAPKTKTVREVMTLNSQDPADVNRATVEYVHEHGEQLFGKDVWADIGPRFRTHMLGGTDVDFSVQLIGDNFILTPAGNRYTPDDGWIIDDNLSLPEARSEVVKASDIGQWYNKKQTTPGVFGKTFNTIIDAFTQ